LPAVAREACEGGRSSDRLRRQTDAVGVRDSGFEFRSTSRLFPA
jgi:hypothetical protein